MLQQHRPDPTEHKPVVVAGQNAGKRVSCSPQALPVFNQLVGLANRGNYWATMIVKDIKDWPLVACT